MKRCVLTSGTIFVAVALLLQSGCGSSEPENSDRCRGNKCDDLDKPVDEIDPSPCDEAVKDKRTDDGQPRLARIPGRLNDPFARFALRTGDTCPTTFSAIMDKLRQFDGCSDSDIKTRVVSETAQVVGQPTSYRAVTTRHCNGRPEHSLLFSVAGVAPNRALNEVVEIIAFDEVEGVFNYYKTAGDEIDFFGTSEDMLRGPQGENRECATCHTGGGLVMKELDAPWLHWERNTTTPGAQEVISAHANFGTRADGLNMDAIVRAGNAAWNQTRLAHMRETRTLAELLEPVFCSVEINLDNGADRVSPPEGGRGGSEVSRIPIDYLLDPNVSFGQSAIDINFDDYDALIKSHDQRIEAIPNAVDTVFDMAFIERSGADLDYIQRLVSANIIDMEFVRDVAMVDFTRPVFSDDRCGLLEEFAPNVANTALSPQAVRNGFINELVDRGVNPTDGTPAAELLNNLVRENDDHAATVRTFHEACSGLVNDVHPDTGEPFFLGNVIRTMSLQRQQARRDHFVFAEIRQTMPVDNLNMLSSRPGLRLHPTNCTDSDEFVAVAEPTEPVDRVDPVDPVDPSDPPDSACAHSICSEGGGADPLDANCHSCVAQICTNDDFCCTTDWDDLCVGQVQTVCSLVCEQGGLQQ